MYKNVHPTSLWSYCSNALKWNAGKVYRANLELEDLV